MSPKALRGSSWRSCAGRTVLAWVWALGLLGPSAGCGNAAPPAGTPRGTEHASAASDEDAARQMDRFTMAGYAADGTKRWELQGRGAVSDGAIVTIQAPSGVGYDESVPAGGTEPRRTYLTAGVAAIHQQTRHVRLEHDVTIHTSDGLWLTSPLMYWLQDREELVTDHAVRIETDQMLLRGRGATGQSQLKTATVFEDIELVFNSSSEASPTGPAPARPSAAEPERAHAVITCDGPLVFEHERGIATFERNVHLVDAQGDLYADRLVAYVDSQSRRLTYAEAIGSVRIVQGAHVAAGQRAVYEPVGAKVTLLGAPWLVAYPDEDSTQAIPTPRQAISRAEGEAAAVTHAPAKVTSGVRP